MKIAEIITIKSEVEIDFKISFIATAAPERVLLMLYAAIKLSEITIVLIEPTKKRNERLSCLKISEPIVAAWPEPIPGRKEQRGAEIEEASIVLMICFFEIVIFFRPETFCSGTEALFFIEIINADVPKRPVNNGRRGSLTGMLNVARPRNPARIKIVKEFKKFFS